MDSRRQQSYVLPAVTLAACAAGTYLILRHKRKKASTIREPPTPPPYNWWLGLTNFAHAPYFAVPDAHRVATKWAEEYGGIYRVYMRRPTYIVTDAALANQALSRGETNLPKARFLYKGTDDFMSHGQPNLFSISDESSDLFRAYRKGLAPCFSTENLRKSFPTVRSCAERLVEKWEEAQAKGEPLEAESWMNRVTLDMIGHVGFHINFRALENSHNALEFVDAMHANLLETSATTVNPLRGLVAKLFPKSKIGSSIRKLQERTKSLFMSVHETVKARGEPAGDDHSIGATLMRIKNPSTGQPFPDEVVLAQFAILLIAGYDTSAFTCIWALYDIARNSEAQKRIKQELAQAGLLRIKGKPAPRQLEWTDLASFPYFNAALKESMRLHPVASTGTFRQATKDVTLGGYVIPKGACVWIPFHSMHNSTVNFTDPQAYDPERWMPGSSAATAAASSSSHRPSATPQGHAGAPANKSVLPFSDGSRNCIGQNLANMDIRTILLTILSRFWLDLDPSVGSHEEVESAQVLALVMSSGRPIKLQLKDHE